MRDGGAGRDVWGRFEFDHDLTPSRAQKQACKGGGKRLGMAAHAHAMAQAGGAPGSVPMGVQMPPHQMAQMQMQQQQQAAMDMQR